MTVQHLQIQHTKTSCTNVNTGPILIGSNCVSFFFLAGVAPVLLLLDELPAEDESEADLLVAMMKLSSVYLETGKR